MKKFLSMVLALAMAMSLVTFAAPAAGARDFTDDGSIQYKEAVDVISAIQIMDGYADASFNPSGTLTRGAASKIICNMILGPTTAASLPTNVAPFPDVAAGSTFAGYIAYCSDHGIISGYADGNFRPADSLSGYAFLKMLLCALGYDQEIEGYQGANWRVNVAKQALGIGLDDDLVGELDGSRIVTREEAALYAFNTLQADLVEYDARTTVSVNGATITTGNNQYHSKTSPTQSTAFDNIDDGALNGWNIVQFAEEYFNRLERFPKKNHDFTGGQDLFGRPSTRWMWKGVEIGTYKVSPAKTYYDDVAVNTIYNDLNLSGTSEDAVVYLNGERMFELDIARPNGDKIHEQNVRDLTQQDWNDPNVEYFANGNNTTATIQAALTQYSDKVGGGTILEVFHDDDSNRMVICAMSVYPGQVTAVYGRSASKDPYVVIEYQKGVDGINGANVTANTQISTVYTRNGHDEYETTELAEDDFVWFTYSNADEEIGEAHRMQSVEGKLDRRTSDGVQLDGNFYDYSKEKRLDVAETNAGLANGSSYIVYLDSAGRVLWLEESEFAAERYALIERISVESNNGQQVFYNYLNANGVQQDGVPGQGSWDTNRARLLLANGTERNVDLDESRRYRNNADNGVNANYRAGELVRFVANDDGTYRLYTVSGNGISTVSSIQNNVAMQFSIQNHTMAGLYKTGHYGDDAYSVRGDSDTIFVVKENDSYRTYTGIRNSPTVANDNTAVAYSYVTGNGNHPTARLVFIIKGNVTNTSKDVTFLAGKSVSKAYQSDEGATYYEYNAVIKGVIQDDPVRVYANVNAGTGILYGPKHSNTTNGDAPNVYAGNDGFTGSIILNNTTFDNDDYMVSGSYVSQTVGSYEAQGIRRTNRTDEVKLDTHGSDDHVEALASSVNIYKVDGDGVIARITVNDIENDNEDMVYYTMDDGDITNLFICDYEDDDTYIARAEVVGNAIQFNWNATYDATNNYANAPSAIQKFYTEANYDNNRAEMLGKALNRNGSMDTVTVADNVISYVTVTGAAGQFTVNGTAGLVDTTNN